MTKLEREPSPETRRRSRVNRELAQANEELTREIAALRQALAKRTRDFQLMVDSIPLPVAVTTPTGEVEALNKPTLDYFGLPVEALKGWAAVDLVHPDDLERTVADQRAAHASGQSYSVESRHRRADGVYRWFNMVGLPLRDADREILCWLHLLIDIDDRKRAEEALRQREREARSLIDGIPVGAAIERPDGLFEMVNQNVLDYFGCSFEELREWRTTAAVVHPDDQQRAIAEVQARLAAGNPTDVVARLRRRDGVFRWFQVRAQPLRSEDGTVARWYIAYIDIDDLKRAEAELDHARTELTHAARAMSLGVLTASIAHEVNQPLLGIVTNANTCLRMLGAEPPNIDGALETARRTIRDGNRASDIITRLRELFGKKEFATECVDLNAAANEVIKLSAHELRRNGIVLSTAFDPTLPPAKGDRVQIQQVIIKLLLNASDAARRVDEAGRRIRVSTQRDGDTHVQLSVEDTGVGLPPDDTRLFEAFYTTKPDGMGIGLSVSKSIIEHHCGRLWAAPNRNGAGATFSFSVPSAGPSGTNPPASTPHGIDDPDETIAS